MLLMVSVLWVSPVLACYNDTAVARGEEEFRSQYNSAGSAVLSQNTGTSPWGIAAMCFGTTLAAGSLIVAIGRSKRKAP